MMPNQNADDAYSVLSPSLLPKLMKASKIRNRIHRLISLHIMSRSTTNAVDNGIRMCSLREGASKKSS